MGTALIIKGADFSANAVGDIGEIGSGNISSGSNKGLGKPIVDNEYFDRAAATCLIQNVNSLGNASYYCRTQPIRVTPGKVLNITIPGFSDFSLRAVLYDASDNNITNSQGFVIGPTYTIPANTVKIGINICTESGGSGGVLSVIPYETAKNMTIKLS